MILGSFLVSFFMFFWLCSSLVEFAKILFFLRKKQGFLRFGHFVFYDIFDYWSTCFWHCFLQGFFIDFGKHFGSMLEPFGIKNMIFSDHDFPCFLVSFFLTFGPKWGPKSIVPDVTFSILFRYFSRPFSKVVLGRLGGRFLMDFWGFFLHKYDLSPYWIRALGHKRNIWANELSA